MFRVFFFVALFFAFVMSAPVKRQIGDLTCNFDRLGVVANLAKTTKDVKALLSAAGNDTATTTAAQTALDGLSSASAGVDTIAKSLLTLQAAPADARDQVQTGLDQANTALTSVNSTDPAVTKQLSKATAALSKTITAGQGVVTNCN